MSTAPKFKAGDVIRYSRGETALMRVESVSIDHAGQGRHRYYGEQCYGGVIGAYEADCSMPTARDLKTWASERKRYGLAS